MIPPSKPRTIRLGSRGSPLALVQAELVKRLLPGLCDITVMKTSGDLIQDRPLAELGGKGLFTKELDEALLTGQIDIAVHSMKDVATAMPEGITLAAMLPREDYHDRLIVSDRLQPAGRAPISIATLSTGMRLGTSSLRRAAQIRHLRPDIMIVPFRGNVGTRLAKLAAGEADATILAAAGLNRLGQADFGDAIPIAQMLPAPAQGAIGIACRADDLDMLALLVSFNDLETADCVAIERTFLAELEGSCRTPIAALARFDAQDDIEFTGELLSVDGQHLIRRSAICDPSSGIEMARQLARDIKHEVGPAMLATFA